MVTAGQKGKSGYPTWYGLRDASAIQESLEEGLQQILQFEKEMQEEEGEKSSSRTPRKAYVEAESDDE